MQKWVFFLGLIGCVMLSGEPPHSSIGKREDGYYSQCQQDKFLNEHYFHNKLDGVFVEVGAYNGIAYSNTKYFEELGWTGICIEPNPEAFQQLVKNRSCLCLQGCISNQKGIREFVWVRGEPAMLSGLVDAFDPVHAARIERELMRDGGSKEIIPMQCYLLNDILETYALNRVDILSIDTEGGELRIVESIDFERFKIDFIIVENNFNDQRIREFLFSKGYVLVVNTGWDDIFKKEK